MGIDIGMGVQTAGTVRLNTQGGMVATENQLNVAIDGRGYFSVTLPDGGTAYTRDGCSNSPRVRSCHAGYRVEAGMVCRKTPQRSDQRTGVRPPLC